SMTAESVDCSVEAFGGRDRRYRASLLQMHTFGRSKTRDIQQARRPLQMRSISTMFRLIFRFFLFKIALKYVGRFIGGRTAQSHIPRR
ncbi:MAG: hypothetical protein ACXWID_19890, partial [Pyrinomonadaceae bacterium]